MAQYNHSGSIRGHFGTTDTRNIGHGSDSESNAHVEIRYFFPNFDFQKVNTMGSVDIHSFLMKDFAEQPNLKKILPKLKPKQFFI